MVEKLKILELTFFLIFGVWFIGSNATNTRIDFRDTIIRPSIKRTSVLTAGNIKSTTVKEVTVDELATKLTRALTEVSELRTRFNEAESRVMTILNDSNSSFNLDVLLNPAKARLYSDTKFRGPGWKKICWSFCASNLMAAQNDGHIFFHPGFSADYNVVENYYAVGCKNLTLFTGTLQVKSIDCFDSCIRVFSDFDCRGQTEHFYPSSPHHDDVSLVFDYPILSMGPCFSQPYGRRYPDDLYQAIIKSQQAAVVAQEDFDRLRVQVEDQQVQLEQLGVRTGSLGTKRIEERWHTCGGLVSLESQNSPVELNYENIGNHSNDQLLRSEGVGRTCIWLIHARLGGPIGYILNTIETDDQSGMLSFQPVLSNMSATDFLMLTNENRGTHQTLNESSTLLIFKSTARRQAFSLTMRDLGRNREERKLVINGNFLEAEAPNPSRPNLNQTMAFAYPPLNQQNYWSLERRYVILKPVNSRKIHLSIDFVDTEETHDGLFVFKFSKAWSKFYFLRSYSGSLGDLTNENFVSEVNEPFFLYFYSDMSVDKTGFQISYSYQPSNETSPSDSTDDGHALPEPHDALQKSYRKCGGLVSLTDFNEIFYENSGVTDETCVWAVWAKSGGGPVSLTLVSMNRTIDPVTQQPHSNLSIQEGFSLESSTRPRRILTENDFGNENLDDFETFTFVVFTSIKNNRVREQNWDGGVTEGFRLKLRDLRERRWRGFSSTLNFTSLIKKDDDDQQISQFAYPAVAGTNYSTNERRFIFLQAEPNRIISLNINFMDSESKDYLKVYTFLASENKFQFHGRFSGKIGKVENASFTSSLPNQPMLLYFYSDHAFNGEGFNFSYSYPKSILKIENISKKFGPTAQLPESTNFGSSCGGLISLPDQNELTYKNLGISSSTSRADEETCIWVIRTMNEGIVGVTILGGNLGDSNSTSSLSLQNGFSKTDNSTTTRIIGPSDLGQEIVHEFPLAVLVFSSRSSQFFHLTIRPLGQNKHSPLDLNWSDSTKRVDRNLIQLSSEDSGFYSYPPGAWGSYGQNERKFLILQPAQGEQMSVVMTFVDMEPNYDFVHIFKWSRVMAKFRFMKRFTGEDGDLYSDGDVRGNTDEPLLVYFQSDGSRHGHGFRLTYSSQVQDPYDLNSTHPVDEDRIIRRAVCGGLVPLDNPTDLVYRNLAGVHNNNNINGSNDEVKTCVWVVWATMRGPIKFNLTQFDLGNFSTMTTAPILTLQSGYQNGANLTVARSIDGKDLGLEFTQNDTTVLLVFTGRLGQGFRLTMSDLGKNVGSTELRVSGNLLGPGFSGIQDDSVHSFQYPTSPGRSYLAYERRHVILQSMPNRRLSLSIEHVDCERDHDGLVVFKFSKSENKFLHIYSFSGLWSLGPPGGLDSAVFEGLENEPFFLYFYSDGSVQGRGFKILYSYKRLGNQTQNFVTSGSSSEGAQQGRGFSFDGGPKTEMEVRMAAALKGYEKWMTDKHLGDQQFSGGSDKFFMAIASISLILSVGLGCYIMWRENRGRNSWRLLGEKIRWKRRGSRENILLGGGDLTESIEVS